MNAFGFPGKKAEHSKPKPTYRADTSSHKIQLVSTLRKSEHLWNDEEVERSLVMLRKAINLLEFIIQNESNDMIKSEY